MCMYGGHMCICIPNMKFLCLTLCQGKVCTDNDADVDVNDDDTRQTKHDCRRLLVDQPNEPKNCDIIVNDK